MGCFFERPFRLGATKWNDSKGGYPWRQNHDTGGLSEPQRDGIVVGRPDHNPQFPERADCC